MTLEEAKERVSQLIAYGEMLIDGTNENDCENTKKVIEAWNVIKKALDNSISKDDIKSKYEDYKERIRYYDDNNIKQDDIYHEYIAICDVLLRLLEE